MDALNLEQLRFHPCADPDTNDVVTHELHPDGYQSDAPDDSWKLAVRDLEDLEDEMDLDPTDLENIGTN